MIGDKIGTPMGPRSKRWAKEKGRFSQIPFFFFFFFFYFLEKNNNNNHHPTWSFLYKYNPLCWIEILHWCNIPHLLTKFYFYLYVLCFKLFFIQLLKLKVSLLIFYLIIKSIAWKYYISYNTFRYCTRSHTFRYILYKISIHLYALRKSINYNLGKLFISPGLQIKT